MKQDLDIFVNFSELMQNNPKYFQTDPSDWSSHACKTEVVNSVT